MQLTADPVDFASSSNYCFMSQILSRLQIAFPFHSLNRLEPALRSGCRIRVARHV